MCSTCTLQQQQQQPTWSLVLAAPCHQMTSCQPSRQQLPPVDGGQTPLAAPKPCEALLGLHLQLDIWLTCLRRGLSLRRGASRAATAWAAPPASRCRAGRGTSRTTSSRRRRRPAPAAARWPARLRMCSAYSCTAAGFESPHSCCGHAGGDCCGCEVAGAGQSCSQCNPRVGRAASWHRE